MSGDPRIRRATVRLWRWTPDRNKAPELEEMLARWPEMARCEHREVDVRTSRNDHGVVVHVECRDCPKGAMQLIRPGSLTWPGEEFWSMSGRPSWAPSADV